MGYNGYTEKKKASNERYLSNFEKPTIRMTKEEKKIISEAAEKIGKSFVRFMVDASLAEAERINQS